MKYLFLLLFAQLATAQNIANCNNSPIKIAVIDSGLGYNGIGKDIKVCKFGHKDFSREKIYSKDFQTVTPVPQDFHGHGTNVAGLIDEEMRKSGTPYCLVIIKYYANWQKGKENTLASYRAIKFANNIDVDFINYSGGGPEADELERTQVTKFLNKGHKFIAAAGNDELDLDIPGNEYYPAQYDERITVVGNGPNLYDRAWTSNWGRAVDIWEPGTKLNYRGIVMSGSSQSTAVTTGKIAGQTVKSCDR